MNSILLYILKSTVCISAFYLIFRLFMRKESSFTVNRAILLTIVAASLIIPLLHLPQMMHTPVDVKLIPEFSKNNIQIQNLPIIGNQLLETPQQQPDISIQDLLLFGYLTGFMISMIMLLYGLIPVIVFYSKAEIKQMTGYKLLIVNKEIPAFSFGILVFISRQDYENHYEVISSHEQAHIRLNHFYDLIFLEAVKLFHWFNPFIYWLIRDLKDIHEFQADDQTLTKGVDATKYQLLIIQKGVGPNRFALANSFNHCQIKNRILMMNKQKTNKVWRWKVAIFLPVLALLLLTFCKPDNKILGTWQIVSIKIGEAKETTCPDNIRAIKFITPNHFIWINYKTENNLVCESAGGSYVFDGENYTENVEYGGNSMIGFFGKSKFKIKVKGDQMFLSGSRLSDGLKSEQVWKKLQ